ncbi:MAG: HAD family hydrolase [Firmicutes bacterium]|nr:HAD family hydrolase [Bacillota bacterium]
MITTIMFDLDGTLVHYDYDVFINAFLDSVARKAAPLLEPKRFVQKLLEATEAMITSLDDRTNMEVFWEHFPDGLGIPLGELVPVLEQFYLEDFPKIQHMLEVRPIPEARFLVERLIDKGYEVIIATNPVFPAIAIEERMRWGGIDELRYHLVTTYETSCYCKPNVEYYAEILQNIGRSPHECIMIGNNTCEDLVARDLGIQTYLLEDCLLDMGPFRREPHYRGSFADLVRFFESETFRTIADYSL